MQPTDYRVWLKWDWDVDLIHIGVLRLDFDEAYRLLRRSGHWKLMASPIDIAYPRFEILMPMGGEWLKDRDAKRSLYQHIEDGKFSVVPPKTPASAPFQSSFINSLTGDVS